MAFHFSHAALAACNSNDDSGGNDCTVTAPNFPLDVVGMDSMYTSQMLFELVLMHAGLLDFAKIGEKSGKLTVNVEQMVGERDARFNKKLNRLFTTNTDLIEFVLHHSYVTVFASDL
jgi:hypothetical protein